MFDARVVRVLIASPSDTQELRRVARQAIEDWNSFNADELQVVFLPLLWERDTIPEINRPQGAVNRQLVDQADVIVAMFWTRLGSPTGEAVSGSAEEVEKGINDERPVLIYFCEKPFPPEIISPAELERLTAWKSEIQERALTHTFITEEEFAQKLHLALTKLAREKFTRKAPETLESTALRISEAAARRAEPLAKVDVERELKGFSKSGSPQYRTRHTLVIENQGTAAAEDFTFSFEHGEGDAAAGAEGNELPSVWNEAPVKRFVPGSVIQFPMSVHMGTVNQAELAMKWREGDKDFRLTQTVTI